MLVFIKYIYILLIGLRQVLQHVGSSSLTRDQTWAPILRMWSLNHWTMRVVPKYLKILFTYF